MGSGKPALGRVLVSDMRRCKVVVFVREVEDNCRGGDGGELRCGSDQAAAGQELDRGCKRQQIKRKRIQKLVPDMRVVGRSY